jgi:SAM-dependent methyltransferase
MTLRTCRICDTPNNAETYLAREKMFGFGDEFTYFVCSRCGCLQIENPDIDVNRFYPEKYYSFSAEASRSGAKVWLSRQRDASAVFSKGLVGKLLLALKPNAPLQALSHVQLHAETRIADVGCGAGHLLHALRSLGFTRLTGIDPNIQEDIKVGAHLHIRKAYLEQVEDEFDLIMFHHSLEHIPDQIAALSAARAMLAPNGVCLVRIPLVSSYAWRTYGTDWVQLDAPRHLFLHSVQSMEILATRTGFNINQVIHDSSEFQFWGSEALRRGIALFDLTSGEVNPVAEELSHKKRRVMRNQAQLLNRAHDGDQAIFLLSPSLASL